METAIIHRKCCAFCGKFQFSLSGDALQLAYLVAEGSCE